MCEPTKQARLLTSTGEPAANTLMYQTQVLVTNKNLHNIFNKWPEHH